VFGITDLTTYIIGTILIVLLPGPNSLYVMSVASRYGIRTGYLAACGVLTGDSILILCTV
jgi:leucine efflux protein